MMSVYLLHRSWKMAEQNLIKFNELLNFSWFFNFKNEVSTFF